MKVGVGVVIEMDDWIWLHNESAGVGSLAGQS